MVGGRFVFSLQDVCSWILCTIYFMALILLIRCLVATKVFLSDRLGKLRNLLEIFRRLWHLLYIFRTICSCGCIRPKYLERDWLPAIDSVLRVFILQAIKERCWKPVAPLIHRQTSRTHISAADYVENPQMFVRKRYWFTLPSHTSQ